MSQDNLIRLQCTECKSFNYHTNRNLRRRDTEKLELKKFCNSCRKHTVHKEKSKD
jgi:large subunit ribosomal protein L33